MEEITEETQEQEVVEQEGGEGEDINHSSEDQVITENCVRKYTVPKAIDFPRYNTKSSGENEILRGIFRVISRFQPFFVLKRKFDLLFGQWTLDSIMRIFMSTCITN